MICFIMHRLISFETYTNNQLSVVRYISTYKIKRYVSFFIYSNSIRFSIYLSFWSNLAWLVLVPRYQKNELQFSQIIVFHFGLLLSSCFLTTQLKCEIVQEYFPFSEQLEIGCEYRKYTAQPLDCKLQEIGLKKVLFPNIFMSIWAYGPNGCMGQRKGGSSS